MSSVRSLIAEQGAWEEVKRVFARNHPADADWLEEPAWAMWVSLDRHVGLLDAAGEVLGLEGLKNLGRQRVAAELESGLFGGIVRSWLRSFAEHPGYLLRVTPYLWRAGFRDCGEMEVVEHRDDVLHVRLLDAPPHLRASEAWRTLLVGFVEGLFDLVQTRGEVRVKTTSDEPNAMDFIVRWGVPSP